MKAWKIAITVITLLFVGIGQVIAKPGNGNGGGKPGGGGEDPPTTSCADKTSAFPAFAYTKIDTSRKGSTKIYLSNADGDCSVLLHTINLVESRFEISYRQIGTDGIIAWRQGSDENAGRKDPDKYKDRVKVIRFQVSGKEVTSSLPLASSEVAVVAERSSSFRYMDLSKDGNTVLVSHGDNTTNPTPDVTYNSIREIDISNCSSNCSVSAPLYAHEENLFPGLSYSSFGDRIYFGSTYLNNSSNINAGKAYLAFIEKQGGVWSEPRILTIANNGNYPNDPSYFRRPDVSITDLGDGPTEIVAFDFDNGDSTYTTQIIDVGLCTVAGAGDCISTGESTIIRNVSDGRRATFNHDGNYSNASSILVTTGNSTENGDIKEHILGSGVELKLVIGYQADAAN